MVDEGDIFVSWVPKENQLADVLTKATASDKQLTKVIQEGTI